MTDGGIIREVGRDEELPSPMEMPESRGLYLCMTDLSSCCSNTSCKGLTFSKIGGSAGEKVVAGGVRFAVDRDESDEFEYEKSGRGPRCCAEDSARDLAPKDLLIDVIALSVELILLCARPS